MKKFFRFSAILVFIFISCIVINASEIPEMIVQTGHTGTIRAVDYSPDGKIIATGGDDGSVILWFPQTGRQFRTLSGHTAGITSVAFSPNGSLLASSGVDGTIRLWDINKDEALLNIKADIFPITSISVNPSGQIIASASSYQIKLWNINTGKEIRSLKENPSVIINSIAFSPDGKILAAGKSDKSIKLWDIEQGKEIEVLNGHAGSVTYLCFSPNGKLLSSSDVNTIKIWDVTNGKELLTVNSPSQFGDKNALAFSPDGKEIACGNYNSLMLIDSSSGKKLSILKETNANISSLSFSPDGNFLLSAGVFNEIWDLKTQQCITSLQGNSTGVIALDLSSDGRYLAQGLGINIAVWDTEADNIISTLKGHFGGISSVKFSPDGKYLVSAGSDCTIRIWDIFKESEIKNLQGHTSAVNCITFSFDGKILASAGDDSKINFWDFNSGRLIKTINDGNARITSIAFSQDAKEIAAGSQNLNDGSEGNNLTLWDIEKGVEIAKLNDGSFGVNSVAFSPNGKTIACGTSNSNIKLWDSKSKKEIRTLQGHLNTVNYISFSPDGKMLASGSWDNTVKLWDITTGKEITTLKGHSAVINSVIFSSSGGVLISASNDGMTKFWSTETKKLLANLIFVGDKDWISVSPEGFFDGTPNGWTNINWRIKNDLYPVELFYEEFYQPYLLSNVLAYQTSIRELLKEVGDERANLNIINKDRCIPQVSIKTHAEAKQESLKIEITISQPSISSGIKDVHLFRNGVLVKTWPGIQSPGVLSSDIKTVGGENKFTAYAFNKDNIKSKDASCEVYRSYSLSDPPKAYILSIGINEYLNPDLNLIFSEPDAIDISKKVSQNLSQVFPENIYTTLLTNEKATRKSIIYALSEIAQKIKPEDYLIITYSGHGFNNEGYFYINPHDIDNTSIKTIVDTSIGEDELEQILLNIDTQYIALIIDACHSGLMLEPVEWRLGPMNSRGLAQLAWEKGIEIITACQGFETAMELEKLGHGILTYVLLEYFDDVPRFDGKNLLINDWFDFTARAVPILFKTKEENGKTLKNEKSIQIPRVFHRRFDAQDWIISGPGSN